MFDRTLLLSALRKSSVLVLPSLLACSAAADQPDPAGGGDPPAATNPSPTDPAPTDPLQPGQCLERPSSFVFVETFNQPIAGWTSSADQADEPGHSWALSRLDGDGGRLVSDPAGWTIEGHENRLDAPSFSLRTSTRGYVRFKTRFQQSGTFRVLISDNNGRSSLLADFGEKNPSWPDLDCVEAPIPKEFIGQTDVHLSLLMVGGPEDGDGAVVDNLRVAARSCAPGSLADGQAPPVLKTHRPFSIGPCPANGMEPPDDP